MMSSLDSFNDSDAQILSDYDLNGTLVPDYYDCLDNEPPPSYLHPLLEPYSIAISVLSLFGIGERSLEISISLIEYIHAVIFSVLRV